MNEYQDTTRLQDEVLRLRLRAAEHRNLCVVGDDDQSIYGWRGANFRNIMEFPKRYPDASVFRLELNYRSVPEILAVAIAGVATFLYALLPRLDAAISKYGA